jgi:serine/threonine protein kinase
VGVGAKFVRCLKSDGLGRVELLEAEGRRAVRRVACGGRVPLSAWVARRLLARERAALAQLAGQAGVPSLETDPIWLECPGDGGLAPALHSCLVREHLEGLPLSQAQVLPSDFFEHLAALVRAVHARGVCHNDLHKEQNVLVSAGGRPALIDFQLASVHRHRGATFRSRTREDLRHVAKHQRRYTRPGRAPAEVAARRPAVSARRSSLAWAWRRGFKPLYELFTRRILGWRDGEPRRPSSGPWPQWSAPIGRGESDYNTSSR